MVYRCHIYVRMSLLLTQIQYLSVIYHHSDSVDFPEMPQILDNKTRYLSLSLMFLL